MWAGGLPFCPQVVKGGVAVGELWREDAYVHLVGKAVFVLRERAEDDDFRYGEAVGSEDVDIVLDVCCDVSGDCLSRHGAAEEHYSSNGKGRTRLVNADRLPCPILLGWGEKRPACWTLLFQQVVRVVILGCEPDGSKD